MELFDARTVVFVHAHPDDETIGTGALIAALVEAGVAVDVLTATRGERGEVRSEVEADATDLAALRVREWTAANEALGVRRAVFLGEAPARVEGRPERRYTDSGMAWVDERAHVAGPAGDAGADSLSLADVDGIAADIAAYAASVDADALVTYDETGGYFHPDHVALHVPTRVAAESLGVPAYEVIPRRDGGDGKDDFGRHLQTVRTALGHYGSQLGLDGNRIVHVGGQRMPIPVRIGVRRMG